MTETGAGVAGDVVLGFGKGAEREVTFWRRTSRAHCRRRLTERCWWQTLPPSLPLLAFGRPTAAACRGTTSSASCSSSWRALRALPLIKRTMSSRLAQSKPAPNAASAQTAARSSAPALAFRTAPGACLMAGSSHCPRTAVIRHPRETNYGRKAQNVLLCPSKRALRRRDSEVQLHGRHRMRILSKPFYARH